MASLDEEGLTYLWEKIKSALSGKVDRVSGKGLSANDYTTAEKNKLAGIAAGANKYVHPIHKAKTSGLYKITVDETGHVSGAVQATKEDIEDLGISGAMSPIVSKALFQRIEAAGKWYYGSDSNLQKYSEIRLWVEIADGWKGWVVLTADDPAETVVTVYLTAAYNARIHLKWDTGANEVGIYVRNIGSGWNAAQVSVGRMEYIR